MKQESKLKDFNDFNFEYPYYTYLLYAHTWFVLPHFILFTYHSLSKSFYKYPSIPLPQVAPM